MRVDKSDLDDSVVEDGEAAEIITDSRRMTTKTKSSTLGIGSPNSTVLPKACGDVAPGKEEHPVQNGGVAVVTKERVPVEDWDGEGCEKEEGPDGVDALTISLKECSIHHSTKLGIEDGLADLTLKDSDHHVKDEEADSPCTSLQSQSSTITVDPPSLPHEREEEGNEVAEDLAPRGPTAGKPTSFQPNNYNFNHISNKSYTTHNLDRFHPQTILPGAPMQQPIQQQAGFPLSGLAQNGLPQPAYYPNISGQCGGGATSGKRGMDDDEDNPYKYTRPVEDPNYMGCQPYMNDLSPDRKNLTAFVSPGLGSGGQVITKPPEIPTMGLPFEDSSNNSLCNLTSEELDELGNLQFMEGETSWQLDNIPSQFDFSQQQIGQVDKGATVRTDLDPGYSSENSPHSDTVGSPGSSPKSTFSPMRPPSNMSQDSGIASPFSSGVPSPPEDYSSQNRNWVPAPEELSNNHFGMGDNSRSPVYMISAQGCLPSSTVSGNVAPSPAHNVSVFSPPTTLTLDDLTLTSVTSPAVTDSSRNVVDLLAGRRDELKDALDVVAKDLLDSNQDKKANSHSHQRAPAAADLTGGIPVSYSSAVTPASIPMATPQSSNIPTSVIPQGPSERPVKLPLPPLVKSVPPGQQQQQQSMVKVPVMVTPVTSSQPLILMPGQTPPVIVVVGNPQPQPSQQANKKKQPVAIRPRPGPLVSSSIPPPSSSPSSILQPASLPQPTAAGDIPCSLPESCLSGAPGKPASSPGSTVSSAQSPGRKNVQNRNNQPARMLTIARRLVASMTTEDLSFQDLEGDTYLHVSVCKADIYMVQALLERMLREKLHSLINTQNNMRQTPVYLAVSSNAPKMVELLIKYNADVNLFAEHTSADGRTLEVKGAIHCAASSGATYLPTLQALLTAKDLNIDLVNSDGHNALHCAILEHGKASGEGGVVNNLPIIQALMKHGIDPNAQGKKSGKTALMYALESRDIVLIEQMVALIDPARLRTCLKSQAFDGTTCLRILDNLQRSLDNASRQRLTACFKLRRDNGLS